MLVRQRASNQYPRVVAQRAKRANDKLRQQLTPLRNAVDAMRSDLANHSGPPGILLERYHRTAQFLRDYTIALDRADTLRAAMLDATDPHDAQPARSESRRSELHQRNADYYASLRSTVWLYDELCWRVKAEGVGDTLTEDDFDAVGVSGVDVHTDARYQGVHK